MTPSTLNVVGFAGSLRATSLNKSLLQAAVEEAPSDMHVTALDIRDVPLLNQDDMAEGLPAPVVRFKEAVAEADGLLIVTPEYNNGMSPVTKNLIDWCTVPLPAGNILAGKPVALMGASGGVNGNTSLARAQVRQSLVFPRALTMPGPEIGVRNLPGTYDESRRLVDADVRTLIAQYLATFAEWVRKAKAWAGASA